MRSLDYGHDIYFIGLNFNDLGSKGLTNSRKRGRKSRRQCLSKSLDVLFVHRLVFLFYVF